MMEREQFENAQQTQERRKFLKTIGATGVGSISILSGCLGNGNDGSSNTGNSNSRSSNSSSKQIQTGGELTLGVTTDISKLDPHKTSAYSSYQLLENIYQKLVYIDKKLKPKSMLAKNWNSNSDKTTYTFNLRKGVKFHPPESKEFTAEDVVYSINRIKNKDTGAPWRSSFMPINDVIAKDDYTVIFKFDKPFAPFLTALSRGYIVPKGADESNGYDISKQPVGTGPFKFKEHQVNSYSTLHTFDGYWRKDDQGNRLPYLNTVTYRVLPQGSSRITNLMSGELDLVIEIPKSQTQQVKNSSNINFSKVNSTSLDYVGYNTENGPASDVKFRQAMSYAISRQSILKGTYFGYGKVTADSIPPSSPFKKHINIDEPFKQNIDKAKQHLKQSNYQGEEIELIVTESEKDSVNSAKIVQNAAKKIGVKLNINQVESVVTQVLENKYQMYISAWTGLIGPDNWTYLLFHSDEGFNFVNYSNDKVDKLLEEGRHATGPIKSRAKYYDKALNIIHADSPYTFLLFPENLMAWRNQVHGFIPYPNKVPRLGPVWVEQ